MEKTVLEVNDLRTEFRMRRYTVYAVNGVSYTIRSGEIVGIVGESGSGKSVSQMSTLRLIPSPPGHSTGEVIYDGKNLLDRKIDKDYLCSVRGGRISMIFQEPMTSLNPVMKVGEQIAEAIRLHRKIGIKEAREKTIELMKRVRIPDAEQRFDCYPHELSGGMCQRIMIAMAMSCEPDLLIADESTTALDVTIQAQILEMLRDIVKETNMALIIVTHNLGIVARYADRIYVMYAGSIVESGRALDIFNNPSHAYTIGLLNSVPRLDDAKDRMLMPIEGFPPNLQTPPKGCVFGARCTQKMPECDNCVNFSLRKIDDEHYTTCINDHLNRDMKKSSINFTEKKLSDEIILELKNVSKNFPIKKGILFKRNVGIVRALDNVNLRIRLGETMGLVGESGCGKTTMARIILNLIQPTSGEVLFRGKDLVKLDKATIRNIRKDIQLIFQDPFASLNPRMTIGNIIGEPLIVHKLTSGKTEYNKRVDELLSMVGLDPILKNRSPHELSGGQRQRVGIARALASEPTLIVCDEPVSALDVSVQAQILNLLERLQRELGLTYLFIAHDLSVVRHISDTIAVMYLGRILELSDWKTIYENPLHPYTRILLSAVPIPDPNVEKRRNIEEIKGDVPSASNMPAGCSFHPRCPFAEAACASKVPVLREMHNGHYVACHIADAWNGKRSCN